VILDLIYAPTFNPKIPESFGLQNSSEENIKFMKFKPETISFINDEVIPFISIDGEDDMDVLCASDN
jgi:hypothetical protein